METDSPIIELHQFFMQTPKLFLEVADDALPVFIYVCFHGSLKMHKILSRSDFIVCCCLVRAEEELIRLVNK